ncbi:hypothetical protein SLS56_004401 [Neofusicoccum ribis]|uniref:Adenylosuccinate lyase C-terminal domain-containing protein n=1 Tax=Neofusicoccum ribis TaxID=45134 RepID=A0ABR3SXB0_9PEZI
MTSVTDSLIFRDLFSTPESAEIWSDERRTSYYLLFESHLAAVQARHSIIPAPAAALIQSHCQLSTLDFQQLATDTALIGYPVLPVVKQLVAAVNAASPGAGEWTHWGATTQDVTDTATSLQLRDSFDLFAGTLAAITARLRALAARHKATPMAARSNLQQAVPMTFGFKLARLLAAFARHAARLAQLRPRACALEFGGAAGTLATLVPDGVADAEGARRALACQAELAEALGLAVPVVAWHTERDGVAEAGGWMALVAATCAKLATDVKLLMQTEVAEVREPWVPGRGSSSTMPQKRNPIASAYVCAAAATVRQLGAALVEAVVADHERSTGPWEIEWVVLPQMVTLTHAALRHVERVLEGLEVDEEAMKRNLDITKGGIVSEAVMMRLGERLGRQYAHDLVYDLCRRAQVEGRSLVKLLVECEEVGLGKEEAEKLCDPTAYLGLSVEMTERVLRQQVEGAE